MLAPSLRGASGGFWGGDRCASLASQLECSGNSWRLHKGETRAPAGSHLGAPGHNRREMLVARTCQLSGSQALSVAKWALLLSTPSREGSYGRWNRHLQFLSIFQVSSWGRLMNLESRVEMLLGERGSSRGLCPSLPLDFSFFLST